MPTFKPQYKDKNGIIQDLNIDYNSLANKPTTKNEIESLKSNINTLDKRVTSIESRLSDRIFKVDSDLAYIKNVPAGALPYASIDMIGGNVVKEPLTNRAKVLGETIKWNQLCDGVNRTFFVLGVSYTISNNKVIRTGTAEGSGGRTAFSEVYRYIDLKEGHVYLNPYGLFINMPDYVTQLEIFTSNTTGSVSFGNNVSQGVEYNDTFYLTIIDLTSIYGTGNEPTDMNDERVQQLIAYAQSHPEYDEGSVRNVELNEVEYCGVNIWDEEWENGAIGSNGSPFQSNSIRSKNFCKAVPNATYYSNVSSVRMCYYDEDFNFLYRDNSPDYTHETPSNCHYFKITLGDVYGTPYKNDICINVSNNAINGTYFPYNGQSITFSQPISLNGLETKDELYSQVEGNELATYKLQRYGKVDLGTLDWKYNSSGFFYALLGDHKKANSTSTLANLLCSIYTNVSQSIWNNSDKNIWDFTSSSDKNICVTDSSYTDVASFKTAMQGVMLVYELATPTITEISRVPLTCDFEQVENVLFDSVLGSTELEKGVLKVQCTEKVVSVGVNIWDEEWKLGLYSTNNGQYEQYTTRICSKNYINVNPNTNYTQSNGYAWVIFYDKNHTFISAFNIENGTFTTPNNCYYINIDVASSYGSTYNHDISIYEGTENLGYFPYFSHNFPIPSSIQALDGYGWGVNDSLYNYVDFGNKKFVKKVGRVDLGTLYYTYNSSNFIFNTQGGLFQAKANAKTLCIIYTKVSSLSELNNTDKSIYVAGDTTLYIHDSEFNNATTFKTAMSGVYLYYELATPVITDISNILTDDNFIEVEANGTLTFENTNKKAVPSKIAYLVEVK